MSTCAFLSLACLLLGFAHATLVNERVERTFDLKTNVVMMNTEIYLRNDGSGSVSSFDFVVARSESESVAEVRASQSGSPLAIKATKESDKGTTFTFTLTSGIASGEKLTVAVMTTYLHFLTPHPAEITQMEDQLVIMSSNLHFFSPYITETSRTRLELPSPSVESYTEDDDVMVKGSTISYGPYDDVAPFSHSDLRVHYKNNYPAMTLTSVKKEVEVSHWGHVSFEEHVGMRHTGAKLKGGFSRLDFQRNPMGSPSHFRNFAALLPASAKDVYYRDVIGNISTSAYRVEENDGEEFGVLELLPRFVMFGGWKTHFYFGYSAPLAEFLGFTSEGKYSLTVPFGTTIQGGAVNDIEVSFILPEGCYDIEVSGVVGLTETRSVRKTYLDIGGRQVVTLSKSRVVMDNNAKITVTYFFPTGTLYRELWMLVGGFFSIFMAAIFFGRFEPSIGEKKKEE